MADCVSEHGHEPIEMDPRHQLRRQVERCQERGFDPVLATEIEFYLTDAETGQPVYDGIQCYSLQKGAEIEHVVGHIRRVIEAYGIVVEASNTEYAPAQVEINLGHGPAIEVCDGTVVFKSVVREIARNHGLRATFMAKPFPGVSGNGLHLHHSLMRGRRERVRAGQRRPAARQRLDAPLGRGPRDARRAALAAREPDGERLQADRGLLLRAHARELGPRQPQRRGALHPAGRRGLARRVPRRRRRRQPVPAGGRPAGRGHGRRRARAGAAARGREATPTPTSACRSCRARCGAAIEAWEATPFARETFGERFADDYAGLARYDASLYDAAITDWETQRYREFA